MSKKEPSELRKSIQESYEQNELDSIKDSRNRARSITVGTAFGGVCEVSLRSNANYLYAQLQPTEVVELIEQLASGIGLDVALRPKVNFASYRGWEEVIGQRVGFDKIAWKGAAAWQLGADVERKSLMSHKEMASLPESLEENESDDEEISKVNVSEIAPKKSINKNKPRTKTK